MNFMHGKHFGQNQAFPSCSVNACNRMKNCPARDKVISFRAPFRSIYF